MRKTIKNIGLFLATVVCSLALVLGIFGLYLISLDDPTTQIKQKSYNYQKESITQLKTPELAQAKNLFRNALEDEGIQIDDGFIRIWSDDGLTTISYYWQKGGDYYKTEVVTPNHGYAYTAAGIIEGAFYKDQLLSAKYDKESGYMIVETTPLHDYDYFYAA